jgi:hypothetical protein
LFGLIGIQVPREFVPLLSFGAFTAMLVIGARLRDGRPRNEPGDAQTSMRREIWRFCRLTGIYVVYLIVVLYVISLIKPFNPWNGTQGFLYFQYGLFVLPPIALAVHAARERAHAVAFSILYLVLSTLLVVGSLLSLVLRRQADGMAIAGILTWFTFVALQVGLFAVVSFAPLRAVNKRLLFLILGVILFAALNEVSKLGLQQYIVAPKPPV